MREDKESEPDSLEDENEIALFRDAMSGVAPLPTANKIVEKLPQPSAIPQKTKYQGHVPAEDSLSDHVSLEIEAGDEWSYLGPGMSRRTLRRLRRGYWGIQAYLDLHGFTRDEARRELVAFLDMCNQKSFRCVRVIHGKGLSSKNHEPVLKTRIGNWLVQRSDVLAFCQARPEDGGGGAVVILLKA
ncbi:MAG: Smr/MutS family protein [Nitrosomonas sp.]|nr:Smr/MutS family protein [Nitrosomonas sp.]